MPQLSSPLSTPAGMPLLNGAHVGKAGGLFMVFASVADLVAAVAAEGSTWPDGQRAVVSEEAGSGAQRVYRTSLSHARTVQIGSVQFVLAADSNLVRLTSGIPANGVGADGDRAFDPAAQTVYGKASGAWSQLLVIGGGGGGGSSLPTQVAYGTVIPLDGIKVMPRTQISGAVALTIGAKVAGGQCRVSFLSDGTNTPSISGSSEWGSSFGYDTNGAGLVNVLDVWTDDGTYAFHAWSQAMVNTPTVPPVAPSWSTAPVVTSATQGSPVVFTSGSASGTPTPALTYRTTLDGSPIGTANTPYTPLVGDVGKALRIIQTATNTAGAVDSSASAAFTVLAAVTPVAPSWSVSPVVTSATVGTPVAFTSGTASGTPTPTKTFRTTLDGSPIGTANTPYTPLTGDIGKSLRVIETATNTAGVVDSSPSAAFTVVAAAGAFFASLVNLTNEGGGSYVATSSGTSFAAQGVVSQALAGDGWIEAQKLDTVDTTFYMGLDAVAGEKVYTTCDFLFGVGTTGILAHAQNAAPTNTAINIGGSANTWVRLRRQGDTLYGEYSTDNKGTWQIGRTFTNVTTAPLYPTFYTTFSSTPRRLHSPGSQGLA